MPKLRRLSGPEAIHILEGFGFIVHAHGVKEAPLDGLTIQASERIIIWKKNFTTDQDGEVG